MSDVVLIFILRKNKFFEPASICSQLSPFGYFRRNTRKQIPLRVKSLLNRIVLNQRRILITNNNFHHNLYPPCFIITASTSPCTHPVKTNPILSSPIPVQINQIIRFGRKRPSQIVHTVFDPEPNQHPETNKPGTNNPKPKPGHP